MNILLVVCDTTRVDHMSCYGYFRETTPNIDSLAKDGIIFEDFYNAGAPTGPAFTCMYTGLYPIRHKIYRFTQPNIRQVDDLIFTMPEILRAWGYTTAAVDNLINFAPHMKHWVRGYEFYINPNKAFQDPPSILAEDVNRRLIPWIKQHSDEEFFLFVHYWDPHLRYNQPQEYREVFHHKKGDLSDLEVKEAPAGYEYVPGWGKVGEYADGEIKWRGIKVSIDLYDGEIFYMDHAIGELITTLKDEGIFEETLIIVTSDHGEQLNQHYGHWGHPGLHDAVTHVPLIIRYPKKLPRGLRVKGFGQHIDLLPTILDIIGAPTEALDMDGRSLFPLLKGEAVKDTIFMEHSDGQRAVRTDKWKLIDDRLGIYTRTYELYNVEDDPLETINLLEKEKEKADELRNTLNDWVKTNLKRVLKEGEKDPAIMDMSKPSRMAVEYREKISQLLESFAEAKSSATR